MLLFIIIIFIFFLIYRSEYFTNYNTSNSERDKLNKKIVNICSSQCAEEGEELICISKCILDSYNTINKTKYNITY